MERLDILEFLIVLGAFILGLIIGLVINSIRKERYSRLSNKDLSVIKSLPGPDSTRYFLKDHPDVFSRPKEVAVVKPVVEQKGGKVEEKILQGAWVCSKCGATDATLIHRQGCDKCYKL